MIRKAILADVPQMVALGKLMHAESKFHRYNFDEVKLASTIEGLIASPTGIALVATGHGDDEVVGGFIGLVVPHYFGNDLAAYDLALFMHPGFRAGMASFRLVDEYIAAAKELGAAEIVLANSTGVKKERVARLFEHAGFKHDGYVFSMGVN